MTPRHLFGRDSLGAEMDSWSLHTSVPLAGTDDRVVPRDASAEASYRLAEEEIALVGLARAGDQEAFGTLVRRHQRQVFSLAVRMLNDPDEASEATQEVFLSAWQSLKSFRGDARFGTWLYRIAYNYCLKASITKQRDRSARAELAAQSAREHTPERLVSDEHARLAEGELRDAVRVEIANLPPKYRSVLLLRHVQELSYEEMAEILRVPIGTVKTQLFRARSLLKERLEEIGRAGSERIAKAGELSAEWSASLRHMLERRREQTRMEADL